MLHTTTKDPKVRLILHPRIQMAREWSKEGRYA